MSVRPTPADRLSLTLPDWRTAAKRRFRKPPRPKDWFWLLYGCWAMVGLVVSIFDEAPAGIVVSALNAGMGWRWGWRGPPAFTLRGQRLHILSQLRKGQPVVPKRWATPADWFFGVWYVVFMVGWTLYIVSAVA